MVYLQNLPTGGFATALLLFFLKVRAEFERRLQNASNRDSAQPSQAEDPPAACRRIRLCGIVLHCIRCRPPSPRIQCRRDRLVSDEYDCLPRTWGRPSNRRSGQRSSYRQSSNYPSTLVQDSHHFRRALLHLCVAFLPNVLHRLAHFTRVLHAFVFFGISYYGPVYFQVLGASATKSGALMIPFSCGGALVATASGILLAKVIGKYRPVIWFGWVSAFHPTCTPVHDYIRRL